MIPCLCINDTNRPVGVPIEEWVKKDSEYNVTWIFFDSIHNTLGVRLHEITQTERSAPYEGFLITRFAFRTEDIKALIEMFKDCNEAANINVEELFKEKELVEI